jgi:hypothetical protein
MSRNTAIILATGAVLLLAVVAWLTIAGRGARPITELDEVYYSAPGHWADFYAQRAPPGNGWIHLPAQRNRGAFVADVDPSRLGFVQPQVCGECHADKLKGLVDTAHFRTSSEASPDTVLGKFDAQSARLPTRNPNLHFELISDNDNLYQRVVVQKDGKTYEHSERFDIVVGSGNHGQTFLYWRGNELYQLPVSFFSESGGWVNSPGFYRDGTADFARGIGHRCLDCHATFFASAAGEEVLYDREKQIYGVTCVRCHGHGWAHVQYHRTHPQDKSPRYIVQPGDLPRDRANEVCAQCHSGVGQLLAPAFTYQPGEPLDQYLHLEGGTDDPTNDDPHAANQLARLMKSRCFQESDNLTCAVCHDPHRQERGDLPLFSKRCGKCHEVDDCKVSRTVASEIADHCVECHMPSRRDVEGAMQTTEGQLLPLLRDHYIKVWPDLARQHPKKSSP